MPFFQKYMTVAAKLRFHAVCLIVFTKNSRVSRIDKNP